MSDRALTIKQPYASLIMAGVKDVENRSWPVPSTLLCRCNDLWCDRPRSAEHNPFPFRLWIHAATTWADGWTRRPIASGKLGYTLHHPVYGDQGWIGSDQLGVLLGSVLVTGCHWAGSDECSEVYTDEEDTYGREIERFGPCSQWTEPDCYHWTLTDPQPLNEPIPMKGRQGLWRVSQVGDRGGVAPTPTRR